MCLCGSLLIWFCREDEINMNHEKLKIIIFMPKISSKEIERYMLNTHTHHTRLNRYKLYNSWLHFMFISSLLLFLQTANSKQKHTYKQWISTIHTSLHCMHLCAFHLLFYLQRKSPAKRQYSKKKEWIKYEWKTEHEFEIWKERRLN